MPSIADRLHQLALALIEPPTLDELLNRAPLAIAALLGEGIECRVVAADERGQVELPSLPDVDAQVCLPLRFKGRPVGGLLVGRRGCPDLFDGESEKLARDAAELLAAAIEQRQRIRNDEARVHSDTVQMRSDLIATLSHEMRTPLASIKGYATALLLDEAEWNDEMRREFLSAIDEESDRLTQLISDILDSSAIDAGAFSIECRPVLLPRLVRRVVDKFSAHTRKHRFILSLPANFPVVEADEHRLDQVLTNLIDNAIKYAPSGGLIVVGGRVTEREVVVTVADQGIGIAPEHLNKLFERYFRARPDGGPAVAGTGLGLPISEAIIHAHGGRIWAESTLGRGTTFSFTLPRSPRSPRPAASLAGAPEIAGRVEVPR